MYSSKPLMNVVDFVEQDEETRQWLDDIDSFRSPPPPRKLTTTSDFSREGSTAFSASLSNGDAADGGDFIDKVKQFQLSDSHPYANKNRVETTKKIAAQGGTLGGLTAMTSTEEKNKKVVVTKDQVNQLREKVRKESRPLNPYPSPYSELERSKKRQPDEINDRGGSDYSSSAYSSYSSAIDKADRKVNGSVADTLSVTAADRSKTAGGSSSPYSATSPVNRNGGQHIYGKSNENSRDIDNFNHEQYRRVVVPPDVSREQIYGREPAANFKAVASPSTLRNASPSIGVDQSQISNVLNDRELSAAFDDFDKDYRDLSNRPVSPNPINLQITTAQPAHQNYSNGGVVRAPPPPYQRASADRLASPSTNVNHYRQSSSVAPSPPVRLNNPYHANNVTAIRNRSQSMQEAPSNTDLNANRTNNINYERAATGRDIIVDRIPSAEYSRPDNGLRSVRQSDSFSDSLSPRATRNVQGHFAKAFVATGENDSQDSIRISPADALEQQQRRFMQLEAQVEEELQSNAVAFGVCHHCEEKVTNPAEATQALGHLYHARCFTCCSCGRALKGKKFYDVRGRVYCEEDYLFSGFQQSAERCGICGHLIMDMILQAVGKSFHPGCFRCLSCKESLDGVPFTMDDDGRVYCINDYHKLFAPKCAKCFKPITPSVGRDETVRVVAMRKNYHVDCYICEGCGLQLTDEPEKRCYPMGEHLLCHRCHIHWSRTGGAVHPITDL